MDQIIEMESKTGWPCSSKLMSSSMHHCLSQRTSIDGPVQVAKASKKRKPRLSIDTNVTRHRAVVPHEVKVIQRTVPTSPTAVAPAFQRIPQVVSVHSNYAQPVSRQSKFPAAYLYEGSRRPIAQLSRTPQELYFEPPPRLASSVYSKDNTRHTTFWNRPMTNSIERIPGEQEFKSLRAQRIQSSGTLFEEYRISACAPISVYVNTPRRSRGWWNVITTPFKTPTESSENFPMPTCSKYDRRSWNVLPPISNESRISSSSHRLSRLSSHGPKKSMGLDTTFLTASGMQDGVAQKGTTSPYQACQRMPFTDIGRTPPSGLEEFSPAGFVIGQGIVLSSRAVVKTSSETTSFEHQSVIAGSCQNPEPRRSSLKTIILRKVRFSSPQHSGFSTSAGECTPDQHNRMTSLLDFSATHREPESRTLLTSHLTKSSLKDSYEEFDHKDGPRPKLETDSKWIWSLCARRGKMNRENSSKTEHVRKSGDKKKNSRGRKCCLCCICIVIGFIILLAVIIALAVVLSHKRHKDTQDLLQHVNLTKFPPMIIGTMSVTRANLTASQSGCVNPMTVWSCALPKEQQEDVELNRPTQPSFLLDIKYDNSSFHAKRSASGSMYALEKIRSLAFNPNPVPPSIDDQKFLGQSTDNTSLPYEGEETPFYLSFIDPSSTIKLATKVKRSVQSGDANNINNFPTNLPKPALNPDGMPQPAQLFPFPQNQPLRLYNRGAFEEHYGFYTYFDRSIFLRDNSANASSNTGVSTDMDGGSPQVNASFRCTWSNTRFLIQIWTRKNFSSSGSVMSQTKDTKPTQFRPFPYPISITTDRHGGGLMEKMLYCYNMNSSGRLLPDTGKFQLENRGFGGSIQNPSPGPNASPVPVISISEGGLGGIDGGTGGCACRWQNFT